MRRIAVPGRSRRAPGTSCPTSQPTSGAVADRRQILNRPMPPRRESSRPASVLSTPGRRRPRIAIRFTPIERGRRAFLRSGPPVVVGHGVRFSSRCGRTRTSAVIVPIRRGRGPGLRRQRREQLLLVPDVAGGAPRDPHRHRPPPRPRRAARPLVLREAPPRRRWAGSRRRHPRLQRLRDSAEASVEHGIAHLRTRWRASTRTTPGGAARGAGSPGACQQSSRRHRSSARWKVTTGNGSLFDRCPRGDSAGRAAGDEFRIEYARRRRE